MKKRSEKNDLRHKFPMITGNAHFSFVEAYKSLRTNMDYLASTHNYTSILLTSPEPNDGKSSVALNLAITMADTEKKVLLIDCDFRKRSLSKSFNIGMSQAGIVDYLVSEDATEEQISEYIVKQIRYNLDILPAGFVPTKPSELLRSRKMARLMKELHKRYDYIIIDTPPVPMMTDAAIISRLVDGVLIVARSNYTTKQGLKRCKESLQDVDANILGVVLNDFDMKSGRYGKDYYSSYKE